MIIVVVDPAGMYFFDDYDGSFDDFTDQLAIPLYRVVSDERSVVKARQVLFELLHFDSYDKEIIKNNLSFIENFGKDIPGFLDNFYHHGPKGLGLVEKGTGVREWFEQVALYQDWLDNRLMWVTEFYDKIISSAYTSFSKKFYDQLIQFEIKDVPEKICQLGLNSNNPTIQQAIDNIKPHWKKYLETGKASVDLETAMENYKQVCLLADEPIRISLD